MRSASTGNSADTRSRRYVRNHRTRRDRLGNDPPLLLIAPPSAADRARYLRAALNDLRVVTNVDHNVHTILYPKRIAIVHHSPFTQLCGVTAPLTVSPCPDAKTVMHQLSAWINHYNEVHPHKALGYRSPREFIAAHARP